MSTLVEIRTFVRDYLDVDEEEMPNAVIDKGARDGSRRIWRMSKRWPHAETSFGLSTVAAQASYGFASLVGYSTLAELVEVRSTSRSLDYMSNQEAERNWPRNATASGEPTHFTVWSDTIRFWPTPNATYALEIRGYKAPTDWVTVQGSPDLPDEFHSLIETWALRQGYLHQDDPEMADVCERQFNEDLSELKRFHLTGPVAGPIVLNRVRYEPMADRLRYSFD